MQSIANMVKELGSDALGQTPGGNLHGNVAVFKIFCGNKDIDGSLLTNVEFDKWVKYSDNTKVWYASGNNLAALIKKEIKLDAPDCLFITGIYSWQFNFKPLFFCSKVKKIISVRGMLHPGALSQKGFKKKIYLRLWKILGLHKKNIFHATDEEEKKYIEQIFGTKVTVVVAANFPGLLPMQPVAEKKEGHLKMISIALISPMKNILLVLQAANRQLPTANCQLPTANCVEYNIYGPVKEKSYWEECLALIKKMPPDISVNYHGDIPPAEIVHVLAQNHVFILPSKSENFGHAMYEALSAGRPVITSMHTPWSNLQIAKAGMNVSIENCAELQKAIAQFVAMNQEELNEWSGRAREYAMKAIDMDAIRKQYLMMFVV